jgi:hypothetical protein
MVERPGQFGTRLRRALLFVCVVWAVATSYVALQLVAQGAMGFAVSHPGLFGDVGLSKASRDSRTCAGGAGERDTAGLANAPAIAWMLGMKLGRDAIARQYATVDRGLLAAQLEDVRKLAVAAGVPPPVPFVPQHAVDANTEFVAYVESDVNATARAFATRFSPETCHLFKLGALWGYASMVRPTLPGEPNIFSSEIRHHAKDVVPAELWQPMLEAPPRGATAQAIFGADSATTERITKHLLPR